MQKHIAKKIAETITNEQLKQMFDNARGQIKDWTKVSSINKSFTKGSSWNILARDFDVDYDYSILAKTNMIREFGEFLPEELKSKADLSNKEVKEKPLHQEPIFD